MTAPTDGLVERLRERGEYLNRTVAFGGLGYAGANDADLYTQAAARIESLLARIEAAEKALEPLLKGWAAFTDDGTGWGNHEEAYQCLAKGMDEHWSAAAQWQAGQEGVG